MTPSNKLRHFGLCLIGLLVLVPPAFAAGPSLLFSPSDLSTSTDTQFNVSVMINTAGQGVSGAGAKIIFDPYYLTAISISTGEIFADYPAAIINNQTGQITISGISSSPTDLYNSSGTFATITFRPYHPGQTKVKYNYVPGSTVDSNIAVMTGNGDILSEVNELTVNITGSAVDPATPTPTSATSNVSQTLSQNKTVKKLATTLGLVSPTPEANRPGREMGISDTAVDPLAPIKRQPPITDPSQTQPVTDVSNQGNTLITVLIIIGLLILLLLIVIIVGLFKKRRDDQVEQPPISPPTVISNPTLPPVSPLSH